MNDHRERELDALMAELRRQDSAAPPQPMQRNARLDAEFRRRYVTPQRHPAVPGRAKWMAIAATLLVASGLAWIAAGRRAHNGGEQHPPAGAASETMTGFFPLRVGEVLDPQEPANLLRIRLRRSEMRRFGLPVSPEWEGTLVDADVVVGQDGTARAVRFVHQNNVGND